MLSRFIVALSVVVAILIEPNSANAQMVKIHFDIEMDTVEMGQFEFTDLGRTETYFRMNFGRSQITNPGAVKYLEGKIVDSITLIHTDYPPDLDHRELNQRRIASLYSLLPDLFKNPFIKWKLVKQTECDSREKAFDFFHGFAIKYHDAPTAASIAVESDYIKKVLEGETDLSDSTLFKVFERNKGKWKSALVVSDLTGSMSPYAAQLLLWFKLHENSEMFQHVTFFNDGDDKKLHEKKIGKTGGIYHGKTLKSDTIAALAYESMQNGSGGDGPENDIEGILSGIDSCTTCDEVVLIADNNSPVRDMKLIGKIEKPVHIILCGASNGDGFKVNVQYLELAYKTKGSIHSIEDDLGDLIELNEGAFLEFSGHRYRIRKGQFIYMGRLRKT